MKRGIWLDKRESFLIDESGEQVQKISSDVESHVRYKGETDHQGKFGGQSVSPESGKNEREHHQVADYVKGLADNVAGVHELLIFGPSEMKMHLKKFLDSDHRFDQTSVHLETADSMTENQMKAFVRDFFSKD
jgi:hypothetical protein